MQAPSAARDAMTACARPRVPVAGVRRAFAPGLLVGLALLGWAPTVRAAGPPEPEARPKVYEIRRALSALDAAGFRALADDEAQGRTLRHVHFGREDVFVDDEPWPTFLNVFHALTREDIVARELLFTPGAPWDPVRGAETVRNLRNMGIFALVAIIPVLPKDDPGDGVVDAFVYTRDLWSLRLESSFSFNSGLLDRLGLFLVERNLLGGNILLGGSFDLRPKTIAIGDIFQERRLFGSRWLLYQSFDVILNRDTGALEGTRGGVNLGVPFWELRPLWGVDVDVAWDVSVGRQLRGATLLTWDDPDTATVEAVPRIWDRAIYRASVAGLRQFGESIVHRLRFGYVRASSDYAPHPDTGLADRPITDPLRRSFQADVLPVVREEGYPFLAWEVFDPTWVVFHELGAFGIAEEVRVGPWSSASFWAPLKTFGSRVDALSWSLAAGFVGAPRVGGDRALVDLMGSLAGRLEEGRVIDQRYELRLRGATPRFFGRIALSAHLELRHRDSFRTLVTLGGDNGLRGFPSQALYGFGADRFRFSLEWRTPPFVLGSVHFGGVLFYDAGGVGELPDAMTFDHAVGVGLRLLFPQFNRFVFRIDLGVPMAGDAFTVLVSIGSTQLLPLTPLEDQKLAQ